MLSQDYASHGFPVIQINYTVSAYWPFKTLKQIEFFFLNYSNIF